MIPLDLGGLQALLFIAAAFKWPWRGKRTGLAVVGLGKDRASCPLLCCVLRSCNVVVAGRQLSLMVEQMLAAVKFSNLQWEKQELILSIAKTLNVKQYNLLFLHELDFLQRHSVDCLLGQDVGLECVGGRDIQYQDSITRFKGQLEIICHVAALKTKTNTVQ